MLHINTIDEVDYINLNLLKQENVLDQYLF